LPDRLKRIDGLGPSLAVMDIRSGQDEGERQAVAVDHDVALGAGFTAIGRVRTCCITPFLAGTEEASTDAHDQSISPAS
jgi:hypothetical protein